MYVVKVFEHEYGQLSSSNFIIRLQRHFKKKKPEEEEEKQSEKSTQALEIIRY